MPTLKNYLIFAFSLLLIFSLHAEEPTVPIGQAPPFSIYTGDTSVFVFPEVKHGTQSIVKLESIEDTVLTPCDIIFFKSGKLEYCKIIEMSPTTVSYKMCDYQDGPTIVITKSTIHKIRFGNGKEEIITNQQPEVNAYVKPRKDPLAKLSLIFGLSAVGIVLLFGVAFIPLILAGIILGIISLAKIGRSKGQLRGKGSAIAGIILCGAIILLILALL